MGTYNTLHTTLRCPRCGVEVDATVDCHFGYTSEMVELKIGDRYPLVRASTHRTAADRNTEQLMARDT